MNKLFTIAVTGAVAAAGLIAEAAPRRSNPDAKLHKYSTTVEKERPRLNEETKRLIAAYRRDPAKGYANVGFRVVREGQVERPRRSGRRGSER